MTIAVYCGANISPKTKYSEKTKELGKWMAENGHRLVYGASKVGLMGDISKSVKDNGGYVIGVEPEGIELINRELADYLDETVFTKDISERKAKMMEFADNFIALPGGFGTVDEITEVTDLIHIGIVKGKMILYNIDGYYEWMKIMMDKMIEEGYLSERARGEVIFAESLKEIAEALHWKTI